LPETGKAALLLGSNVGDRRKFITDALTHIGQTAGTIIQTSSFYETAAWGITDQDSFLNLAVLLETKLDPHPLLHVLLQIEEDLGRKRTEKWGPRIIDIDILYYDDLVIDAQGLTVPHPFMQVRRFSLEPLLEISPAWVHPILHLSVQQMLDACPDEGVVTRL